MVFHIIILAGGIGKRMKSKKVKVLHEVMERPMITWVIDLAKSIPSKSIVLVFGKKGKELKDKFPGIKYAFQKEPNGTGAAVEIALHEIEDNEGNVIVLSGDTPLLSKESLEKLVNYHEKNALNITIMTFCPVNPTGYGRIIRKKDKIIAVIREGECFGEMAYIAGQARIATAIADTDCMLMKISATLLDKAPEPIQLLFFKNLFSN